MEGGKGKKLFDDWPDRYEEWFLTPIGRLVKACEEEVILDLLRPGPGEVILDAGCGTGIFTTEILSSGAKVVGVDLSVSMLRRAKAKTVRFPFFGLAADMLHLPFPGRAFDKAVSVTALEFIEDEKAAVSELSRVTKPGGAVVVATLNRLSPWAIRRKAEAAVKGGSVFRQAIFRSPDELEGAFPGKGVVRTAVHFLKDEDPVEAERVEAEGRAKGLETGAFLAVRWKNR